MWRDNRESLQLKKEMLRPFKAAGGNYRETIQNDQKYLFWLSFTMITQELQL